MVANSKKSKAEKEYVPLSQNPEDYVDVVAELPEFRGNYDPSTDYPDVEDEVQDDVQVWSPITEGDERCIPLFMTLARSALTYAQVNQGVTHTEAMENSCGGYGEQYISDVLHDSGYLANTALKTLLTKEIPHKVSARWTAADKNLFEEGLTQYRKDFTAIRTNLLPHKTTMDIVEYYYTWKRSKQVKGRAASRARAFLRRRNKPRSLIIGSPTESGILTRSQLAAKGNPNKPARVPVSRKDVYTSVKRRRRSTKPARSTPAETETSVESHQKL